MVSVEQQRVSVGLNPRAVFLGTRTAMVAGNITARVATNVCSNFTLQLRVSINQLLSSVIMGVKLDLCFVVIEWYQRSNKPHPCCVYLSDCKRNSNATTRW